MQPVDFAAFVQDMRQKDAFRDYETPLGPKDAGLINPAFHNPVFPGDRAYSEQQINDDDIFVPQEMIDAHHQSLMDAQTHYMNPKLLAQHICLFSRGNYNEQYPFRYVRGEHAGRLKNTLPDLHHLPHQFSFDTTSPDRKSYDGWNYFTHTEILMAKKIGEERPDITRTLLVFQAGCIDYLMDLGAALSNGLQDPQEKSRGIDVNGYLLGRYGASTNFIDQILPAVLIAFFNNHRDCKATPTAQDFESGFAFAFRTGMFQSKRPSPGGTEVKVKCPARVTLGASSSFAPAADGRDMQRTSMGGILEIIHQSLNRRAASAAAPVLAVSA